MPRDGKLTDKRKADIREKVEAYGAKADGEDVKNVEEKLGGMNRGPVALIWDKVTALWNAFRSPETPAHLKALIIGGLIYLVTPVDVIPDVIPAAGLIDDVFAITTIFASASKVLKGGDFHAFSGVAGKVRDWAEKKAVDLIEGPVAERVGAELEKAQLKSLVRSLLNFLLYLFSVLLVCFPVFGDVASPVIASLALTGSLVWMVVRFISSARRNGLLALDILKASWRKRSLKQGALEYVRTRLPKVASFEKYYDTFFRKLGLPENKPVLERLADKALAILWKRIFAFALSLAAIGLCFFIMRRALMAVADVSFWEVVLWPYVSLWRIIAS